MTLRKPRGDAPGSAWGAGSHGPAPVRDFLDKHFTRNPSPRAVSLLRAHLVRRDRTVAMKFSPPSRRPMQLIAGFNATMDRP
jgi:hypothetical protein